MAAKVNKNIETHNSLYLFLGNYIRDDTDFILKDNFRQLRHQLYKQKL